MDIKQMETNALMQDYKKKIDSLTNVYSQDEIEMSKTENNAYRQAVNALIAERDQKVAALSA